MATRKPLKRKKGFKIQITDEYLESLKFRDFMGELTDEEISIAKAHGLYDWDPWVKGEGGRFKDV